MAGCQLAALLLLTVDVFKIGFSSMQSSGLLQFIDKTFILFNLLIIFIIIIVHHSSSHLYSVVAADATTGELFSPAGPGQEDGGGHEAEGDDGEPGEATPGGGLQQVEGVQVLPVTGGSPGLRDTQEDRRAAHPADDEAAQRADGDGLVGVVGERPQHGGGVWCLE